MPMPESRIDAIPQRPLALESPESHLILMMARMKHFNIDVPGAARPFSKRLQEEQGWSAGFTARAIEEYKRFMILAATLDGEVTPSKTVDEVWHAHLLYSKNYRDDMCTGVLGKVIDHNPGNGGAEDSRYGEQYVRTLLSYRAIFGEKPPADIWPLSQSERACLEEILASRSLTTRSDTSTAANRTSEGGFYDPFLYDVTPPFSPSIFDGLTGERCNTHDASPSEADHTPTTHTDAGYSIDPGDASSPSDSSGSSCSSSSCSSSSCSSSSCGGSSCGGGGCGS